jgi:beta-1,4-mannosyl-glycoprotein beta-1,4-N-acetylglucosaminyltransferase
MLLGELARGRNREALRSELAACQSAVTRNSLVFRTVPQCGPRQIFDLFPYNGEIELLRIKLHEMSPWVDRFVIVEAATTFSGHPKPLYFASHSAQIEPFLSKISYVPIENFPEHVTSAWAREFYQRDQAIAALDGCCGPNDLLLLTDVDEVLERRAVVSYRGEGAPVTMHRFRFFLNYRLKDKQHGNASIWRGVHLERWGSSFVRAVLAGRFWHQRVPNAGWHFTSVGDANDITRKLASYAHQEHNRPSNKATYASVLENIRAGEVEPGWEVCKDELLPVYVQERPKCLEHLFLSRGAPQPALKSARAGESA